MKLILSARHSYAACINHAVIVTVFIRLAAVAYPSAVRENVVVVVVVASRVCVCAEGGTRARVPEVSNGRVAGQNETRDAQNRRRSKTIGRSVPFFRRPTTHRRGASERDRAEEGRTEEDGMLTACVYCRCGFPVVADLVLTSGRTRSLPPLRRGAKSSKIALFS